MVSGLYKSRRLKKVQVKCPKGVRTHFRQRNRSATKCAVTKMPLSGIKRLTNKRFGKLNKSAKKVSRAYGGYMSHIALKEKILNEIVLKE